MTTFARLMAILCEEAHGLQDTILLRPELVPEDEDLNDWATEVINELRDMRYLLHERARRGESE